ncbi:MAG: hypothetical protein HY608_05950 [Planctomycetes bacterium]|nr:hypothetical protein [Planctomycetota bacterium]
MKTRDELEELRPVLQESRGRAALSLPAEIRGGPVSMGCEEAEEWDIYPEREAILVGTQDMLLSRALNRGYAASRAR